MLRTYIFVYGNAMGSREEIKQYLDSIPEIKIWRYELPNCFFIISKEGARFISDEIKKNKHGDESFLITEIHSSNYWGWLTDESWHIIQHQEVKPD